MNRLSKDDLAQMNRDYFQSLDKEKLVEVAGNLHAFAVEQFERLEQNSSNSSKPPSSDNPYKRQVTEGDEATGKSQTPESVTEDEDSERKNVLTDPKPQPQAKGFGKKLPGKQPGEDGDVADNTFSSKCHNYSQRANIVLPAIPNCRSDQIASPIWVTTFWNWKNGQKVLK